MVCINSKPCLAFNKCFNSQPQPFCFYKSEPSNTDSLLCLHAVQVKLLFADAGFCSAVPERFEEVLHYLVIPSEVAWQQNERTGFCYCFFYIILCMPEQLY